MNLLKQWIDLRNTIKSIFPTYREEPEAEKNETEMKDSFKTPAFPKYTLDG